ncbi:hypothetical protein APLC1_6431 [Limnospira platensis C1]|nr:hypothetical protein APLC1_6431 [Arthrospira platensis C1]
MKSTQVLAGQLNQQAEGFEQDLGTRREEMNAMQSEFVKSREQALLKFEEQIQELRGNPRTFTTGINCPYGRTETTGG